MEVILNLQSVDEVVGEIMRIHRSLPIRPSIDEVEAARALIWSIEKEDQSRLDAIGRQTKGLDVPEELFLILQEMQRNFVYFQSKEQKQEAMKLLDLENAHALFDEYIQRASECLSLGSGSQKTSSYSNGSVPRPSSGPSTAISPLIPSSSGISAGAPAKPLKGGTSSSLYYSEREPLKSVELFSRDDSYVKKAKSSFYADSVGLGPTISVLPQIQDSTLKAGSSLGLPLLKSSLLLELTWQSCIGSEEEIFLTVQVKMARS